MNKRGRKPKALNEQKPQVVHEQFLAENPEGHPHELSEPVVVATKIPEMRTFIFINGRDPNCALEFHYHSKTHYLKQYTLLHGHQYTLPAEVCEHLESRAIPCYAYKKGADGHPEAYVSGYTYLYQCRNVGKNPDSRMVA